MTLQTFADTAPPAGPGWTRVCKQDRNRLAIHPPQVGFNDHISLTAGYLATVSDSAPGDLQMGGVRISSTYGWHKVVEGQKRLKSGE